MDLKDNKNFMIILAIAIAGFIFFIYSSGFFDTAKKDVSNRFDEITTQSSSDEVETIEADLEATDFSDIDRELQEIENELDQTY